MAMCKDSASCRDFSCTLGHVRRRPCCPAGSRCKSGACGLLHPEPCRVCAACTGASGGSIDHKAARRELAAALAKELITLPEFDLLLQRLATTCPCACGLPPASTAPPPAGLGSAKAAFAALRAGAAVAGVAKRKEASLNLKTDIAMVERHAGLLIHNWIADKMAPEFDQNRLGDDGLDHFLFHNARAESAVRHRLEDGLLTIDIFSDWQRALRNKHATRASLWDLTKIDLGAIWTAALPVADTDVASRDDEPMAIEPEPKGQRRGSVVSAAASEPGEPSVHAIPLMPLRKLHEMRRSNPVAP